MKKILYLRTINNIDSFTYFDEGKKTETQNNNISDKIRAIAKGM